VLGLKSILLTTCMLIAVDVAAAEPSLPDASACSGQADHAGLRACLEQRARAREARIAASERRVKEAISRWDQEQEYRDRSLTLLDASRRAYLAQRSATCEVEASTAAGGNSAGDIRLQCQERWDLKWLEQLAILEKMFGRDA
jgi:uncharacterized protein YecT (DUF1311 family)